MESLSVYSPLIHPHIRFQVNLLFIRSRISLYKRLSINVIREVVEYNESYACLLAVRENKVRVYSLETGKTAVVEVREDFADCGVACFLDQRRVMVFRARGDGVRIIDIVTLSIRPEPPMTQIRLSPGVIRYSSHVWAFGGYPSNFTCEKFSLSSRTWTAGPAMRSAKARFTPCVLNDEIYLPSAIQSVTYLDVFTPATEEFRMLAIKLAGPVYGTVSTVWGGEMVVLCVMCRIGIWKEEREVVRVDLPRERFGNLEDGLAKTNPVQWRGKLYWVDMSNDMRTFDLTTRILE